MRAIKVYCPPGVEPPLYAFIDALDGKLKAKLLWQIFRLRNLPACELKEPHFKHFSLERYSQMYELREKGKVLIRIVFTVQNEDVILLTSFIKRQPRDTMKALDQSLYILSDIQQHPDRTSNFDFQRGGHGVKKLIYRISAAIVVAGIIIMKRRTQRT